MQKVYIYTDGACRGNPGPGGWAALLRYQDKEKIITGGEHFTTNNRMELAAAINGLHALRKPCQVELFTDSQYVKLGITKWLFIWKKRNWNTSENTAVKNQDLWKQLSIVATKHELKWNWVKGHNGHPENERVDCLARKAIPDIK